MSRLALAQLFVAAVCGTSLAGCYVVPIGADGRPYYGGGTVAVAPLPPDIPMHLTARLYPENDAAAATGVLTGSVTNFLTGHGQFTLNIAGETLAGEATRNGRDTRRGIASAYGSRGTTMTCDYVMNHATQGTGSCVLGNGARYRMHLGA